jgi:hypothetical protein
VVADKARESWRSKQAHTYSKLSERVRKANKQRAEKGLAEWVLPDLDGWVSAGRLSERDLFPPERFGFPPESGNGSAGIPAKADGVSAGIPPENALKGNGTYLSEHSGAEWYKCLKIEEVGWLRN